MDFCLAKNVSLKMSKNKTYLFNYYSGKKQELNSPFATKLVAILEHKKKIKLTKNQLDTVDYLVDVGFLENKKQPPKIIKYKGPFLYRATLHITPKCNLNCYHCYIKPYSKQNQLGKTVINTLAKDMQNMSALNITITGGEPFLRKDLIEVFNYFYRREIRIENIFTNGTLLSKKIKTLKKIKELGKPLFYVSLDGLENEHNSFRKNKTAFKSALAGIETLNNLDFNVVINISLNKLNLNNISKIHEIIQNYDNVIRVRIDAGFRLGGWLKSKDALGVSSDEELTAYKKYISCWDKDNRPYDLECGHMFRYLYKKVYNVKYTPQDLCCDYNLHNVTIWHDGAVTSCALMPKEYAVGNIKNQSLKEIWESEKMQKYKNLKICDIVKKNINCKNCKYLRFCGTGCRANALHIDGIYENYDKEICLLYKSGIMDEITELEKGLTRGENNVK